jgi:hypothetical protein
MKLKWPGFKFLQGYVGMWQLSSITNSTATSSPTLVLNFIDNEYKEGSI